MLSNARDQMLIESPPFETGHGKGGHDLAVAVTRCKFCQRERTEAGSAVKGELGLGTRLAVA
jgi:hypothetical protein